MAFSAVDALTDPILFKLEWFRVILIRYISYLADPQRSSDCPTIFGDIGSLVTHMPLMPVPHVATAIRPDGRRHGWVKCYTFSPFTLQQSANR